MATTRDLAIKITGDSKSAVKAFDDVGDAAQRQKGKFDGLKVGATIASAAVVAGVAKLAGDSIAAYTAAEQSQAALAEAYEKFPAITDVSIEALRELNTEIQRKTGFDDDALAASQATLAQFGLTGEQIKQLTPLMADYAAKTGKDIESAATDMGKAILGQGRALKNVGIEFSDTGDAAGNFEQLVSGLDGTVGGFAETMGDTAAGKAQILEQSFGDLQEMIGEMLIPALEVIVDVGTQVTQWMADNPDVVQALAIALGVLVVAIIAVNVAMWALSVNPIVLIIMAIVVAVGLLVAGIWWLVANWDQVWAAISFAWQNFMAWIKSGIDGFVAWWNGLWTAVGLFLTNAWNNWIVNPIKAAVLWIWNTVNGFLTNLRTGWEAVWTGVGNFVKGIWNNIIGWVEGGVNGAIDLINGLISAANAVGSVTGGWEISLIPHVALPRLATGGLTSGPMAAIIGDNPGGRELVQPLDRTEAMLERVAVAAATRGGGGDRPIYADGIGLIGWIRDLANGEAQLVWNQNETAARRTSKQGRLATP